MDGIADPKDLSYLGRQLRNPVLGRRQAVFAFASAYGQVFSAVPREQFDGVVGIAAVSDRIECNSAVMGVSRGADLELPEALLEDVQPETLRPSRRTERDLGVC